MMNKGIEHPAEPTLRVEIWADITCPFCYIGETLLARAIGQMEHPEQIRVEWRSCLLNPMWELGVSRTWSELMSEVEEPETQAMYAKKTHLLQRLAEQYQLMYNLPLARSHNSREAARLLKWAGDRYQQTLSLAQAFGKGYFSEALDMGAVEHLLAKVKEVGLPSEEALAILQSDAYLAEVEADQEEAQVKAYNYVPTFYFNGAHMLEGVVTEADLLAALQAGLKG